MDFNGIKYQTYIDILKEELIPAMGCTEPIALAYCASIVRQVLKLHNLDANPLDNIEVIVSGNILKNIKSVTVPNTNGLHGIPAAVAVGFVCGDCYKKLEVIASAKKELISTLPQFIENNNITIIPSDNNHTLYIEIKAKINDNIVCAIIQDSHTFVHKVTINDKILYFKDKEEKINVASADKTLLNIIDIIKFGEIVEIDKIKSTIDRQINYNMAIAEEGLCNNYGANVGKTILKYSNGDIMQYCKAYAAAGSDARMNGCDLPVVINSGSGNQGLTASVPVIAYYNKINESKNNSEKLSKDLLYRALVISNLITIHIKNNIGKLSAFCGVVIAGAGCGAGIAYLEGGKEREICHTIVNTLANVSGIVCDGAKSSCAAKIASSVEAGIFGYYMFKEGNQFYGGDGIIKKGVEKTIAAIGKLARVGMCETDKEIINIMIDK